MYPRSYVTVVTGLPRSGTSLMCAMLQSGGVAILWTPNVPTLPRKCNPLGCFEFEGARRVETISSWIKQAEGKAFKLFLDHVHFLPRCVHYRVVCMRRSHEAVKASFRNIFGQEYTNEFFNPDYYPSRLARFRTRSEVNLLEIDYESLIDDPQPQCAAIAKHLDGLDVEAMAAIVDRSLKHF